MHAVINQCCVAMEGYQCQKSTLCNKRSNKKRMRYFVSARLSIWRKANRTLVYQSRLSTPRWPSAEILILIHVLVNIVIHYMAVRGYYYYYYY